MKTIKVMLSVVVASSFVLAANTFALSKLQTNEKVDRINQHQTHQHMKQQKKIERVNKHQTKQQLKKDVQHKKLLGII
jgi:Ni/Co efflux regulator RcnB